MNLPVELGHSYNCIQCKKLSHTPCVSSLLVLYIMTQRPLFAASWWSHHFVCTVSSGELHENVKKENCPYRCTPFYARTARFVEVCCIAVECLLLNVYAHWLSSAPHRITQTHSPVSIYNTHVHALAATN